MNKSMYDKSKNKDTFGLIMKHLKTNCQDPCVAVLDNIAVTDSKIFKVYYDEFFKKQFLPPFSCTLNPKKRLSSVVKDKWMWRQLHEAISCS